MDSVVPRLCPENASAKPSNGSRRTKMLRGPIAAVQRVRRSGRTSARAIKGVTGAHARKSRGRRFECSPATKRNTRSEPGSWVTTGSVLAFHVSKTSADIASRWDWRDPRREARRRLATVHGRINSPTSGSFGSGSIPCVVSAAQSQMWMRRLATASCRVVSARIATGVNGQVAVPTGGQLKVPTLRGEFSWS